QPHHKPLIHDRTPFRWRARTAPVAGQDRRHWTEVRETYQYHVDRALGGFPNLGKVTSPAMRPGGRSKLPAQSTEQFGFQIHPVEGAGQLLQPLFAVGALARQIGEMMARPAAEVSAAEVELDRPGGCTADTGTTSVNLRDAASWSEARHHRPGTPTHPH